jgi:hypothetical protein
MFKCANCGIDAQYEYSISDSIKIVYCQKDLPKFLKTKEYSKKVRTISLSESAAISAFLAKAPKNANNS